MKRRDDREGGVDRRGFLRVAGASAATLPWALQACGETNEPLTPDVAGDAGADAGADVASDVVENSTVDPQAWDEAQTVAWDPEAIPLDAAAFPLTVQAGAMQQTAVILCGFVDGDTTARLRVWRDGGAVGEVALVHDGDATGEDGYLKLTIEGLAPATWYAYAFFTGGDALTGRSEIGRFRTAFPEDWLASVTVNATACTNQAKAPWPALSVSAESDFDVFVQLGDFIYNDNADTTDEYRANWKIALGSKGYRDVLTRAGQYITLDDHEVSDNSKRYDLPSDQYQDALDAWFEAVPVPRIRANRFWDSYRWGRSVEFFVLDCRTERQPATIGGDDVYISREQMDWLKTSLSESPCHFKVVLNSVPILGFTDSWPSARDRWQGYDKQREELLDHIVDGAISNVWFLTGDFHMHYVGRVELSGGRERLWEIMCGPGGPKSWNPAPGLIDLEPDLAEVMTPPGQFEFMGATDAATILTFDPEADTVSVLFRDAEGATLYEATLNEDGPV